MKPQFKRVLIFDMDIVAYRSASAIEERTINVIHKSSGREKSFKTRTEFKKFLKEKNYPYNESKYEIKDIQTIPKDKFVLNRVIKAQVDKVVTYLDADEVEGYIGSKENFRLQLELPTPYKGNREETIRPLLLQEAKDYILNRYKGGVVKGYEVDDHIIVRWHELKAQGHDPIVVGIDKDSKGCIGISFFDFSKEKSSVIDVPVWGNITYDNVKKKVSGIGLQFYAYQLLKGDPSDSYTPSDLHNDRFGDVSIVNLINSTKTPCQLFDVVENKFKEWFPNPVTYIDQTGKKVTNNYEQLMEIYHQCVYMKRKVNDKTTYKDLRLEFCENYKNDNS